MIDLSKYLGQEVKCPKTDCLKLITQILEEKFSETYEVPERADFQTPKDQWIHWIEDNGFELLPLDTAPQEKDLILVEIGAYISVLMFVGSNLMFGNLAAKPAKLISYNRWKNYVIGIVRKKDTTETEQPDLVDKVTNELNKTLKI